MKKIKTLSLLLATAIAANAQQSSFFKNETSFQKQFHGHVQEMLNRQGNNPLQKTTVMQERVVAASSYLLDGTGLAIADSTMFKYSGNNGSKFDYNYMDYGYTYPIDLNPSSYPYQWTKINVVADSVKYFKKDSSTSPLLLSEAYAYIFNLAGNIATSRQYYYTTGMPDGFDFYYNTYDGQGNLTRLLGLTDNGGSLPDSNIKVNFHYDAQNRNSLDTAFYYDLGDWIPIIVLNYTYDANNNVTLLRISTDGGNGIQPQIDYAHTFYPNNRLKTVIGYQYSGATPMPSVKDTFSYLNNVPFFTTLTEYQASGANWTPSLELAKSLNTQNLPDTFFAGSIYNATTNTFTYGRKLKYTYDSYNNPVKAVQYDDNGTAFAVSGAINYYYEVFNNTNSVKNLATNANIQLYPNPTTNAISLQWKEGNNKQTIAQVTNASGQLIMSKKLTWNSDNVSLPVDVLNAGVYFITVRDESGAAIFASQFIKK
jgi:hypothetical protein